MNKKNNNNNSAEEDEEENDDALNRGEDENYDIKYMMIYNTYSTIYRTV